MAPADSALDIEGQLPWPRRHRPGALVSIDQALDLIPDRARVYVAPIMGVPTTIVAAMADQRDRWSSLETTCDYLLEPLATFDAPGRPFTHCSVQPTGATRSMEEAGALRLVPSASSLFSALYRPGGALAVDVAVVQVSLPASDGTFSLGVNGAATPEVVRTAPVVIAEVNPAMPYLPGAVVCRRSDFDALVEVDHPLVLLESQPGDLESQPGDTVPTRIGAAIAEIVPDGATIEYGIGAIPDAALSALSGHRSLGLHSGMLGDGVMGLIDDGVLDGSSKGVDRGLHVVSTVIGSQRCLDWVSGRDDVVIVASNYSHGAPSLARQNCFVAINSAVEVALDGAVNAETVGTRIVSGPGGQPDFALGATLSPGGRNIVALPATARRGTVSRIVARLGDGAPTTVPRHLADQVVTEYGVAELRGIDLDRRRHRLASIGHPDLIDESWHRQQ